MKHFSIATKPCIFLGICLAICLIPLAGCKNKAEQPELVKHYPVNGMSGLIDAKAVEFDAQTSADTNGSFHIRANNAKTVRLYETGDIDVENAKLLYRAMVKTENVKGTVYLEMWCRFGEKGRYFSRDLDTPVTGTRGWETEETPFFLKKGENPDAVELNIVINGSGDVWVDDIRLLKTAMP